MNKQSLITILFAVFMSMTGVNAFAFKVKNSDGVPINYDWINNNTELAVSCYYESDNPYNDYTGDVVIPESVEYGGKTYKVTSISSMAFFNCRSLTSVTIPNNVTTIGEEVFDHCFSLASITIPNSVTFIDINCFEDTPWYKNQPDGLIYAGKVAYKYKGKMPANTHIDIKDGTLGISSRAFSGYTSLTSVTIPSSVTNIGYDAFENTSITSIIIPKSVTDIKSTAFRGCSGLASIQVESDNQYYDSRNNCNAIIDSNNQLIIGCKNTIIPNSVTSIGNYAFSRCTGLTSVIIPKSVTSFSYNSFRGCSSLASIQVESGNPNYDSRNNCNAIIQTSSNTLVFGIKSTIIPYTVTFIGESAFYDCSGLTSITIPNSVTSIGQYAFWGCSGLVYVTLPSRLTSIGYNAFNGCNRLTDVYCNAVNVPSKSSDAFFYTENITLHVPYESLIAYKSTEPWNKFKSYSSLSSSDLQASEKCSKPTIGFVDGKFIFNCETPEVFYKWIVSTPYGNNGNGGSVPSPITLNVFATKPGYLPSDVTIYEFSGLVGDVNGDNKVDVADHVKLSEIIMGQK